MTHVPPCQSRPQDEDWEREFHSASATRNRRIRRLLEERRKARPPRLYTRACVIVGIAAIADWVLVAYHTATARGRAQDAMIGTHQAIVAALSIIAVCLTMGWVLMEMMRRFEVQRDEIEELRHQDRIAMVEWAMRYASQREWQSYAVGVQEGRREGRGHGVDAPTQPLNPVVPFSQRGAPSRNPGHRYSG